MPDSNFRPMFQEHVALFRGIVSAEIDNEGDLVVEYADGTTETLGPVSSFAYAVDAGIAGEGTDYPTFESWAQHVADMSQAASDAQAWAEGKRGETDVGDSDPTYHNNSKYYSEQAESSAADAASSATNASNSATAASGHATTAEGYKNTASTQAQNSECWAVGTKNGTDQTSTDSAIPGTTNNSKYYSTQASNSATSASDSATLAETYKNTSSQKALVSEGYAVGTQDGTAVESGTYFQNNAKYYSDKVINKTQMTTNIKYQSSESSDYSTLDPDGWQDTVQPQEGNYLWSKMTITFGTGNNATTSTFYSVGYVGAAPGTGAVNSVNGITGEVTLTGYNLKVNSANDAPTILNALTSVNSAIADKVVAYDTSGSFPGTGVDGNLYISKDDNMMFRWDSTEASYIPVSGGGGTGPDGIMNGASDTIGGSSGAVPAPVAGDNHKFLCGDASWKQPVTSESVKAALNVSAEETKKFLNENGEWKTVDADNLVHTTGTETITGQKTFTSSPVVASTTNPYKYINYSNGSEVFAKIRADSGETGRITKSQIGFAEYSPKTTPDAGHTGSYEAYYLPECTPGLATPVPYNILTSKNAVTVEQGGTGAASADQARVNLGLGDASTHGYTNEVTSGSTSSDLPSAQAVANFVDGKNYFSKSGGTISGPVTVSSSLTVNGGITASGNITGSKVYNAVWNDYAECRNVGTLDPGYCVTETSSGVMYKTWERLQPGCKMTSDTYGTCMGETDEAQTPIAVAGRVLAYPYRDISEYRLGDAVCSAPDGKIDIMTREEIKEYPERIIGTVSEIPGYDVWYGGTKEDPKPIQVNGRIWIYVR